MKHAFERERRIAIEAVCEAAQLCKAVQAEISREALEKKDKSPVTVADFGSQALICRTIREAFAGDPIIAEEDSAELRNVEYAGLAERVLNHVRRLRPAADAPAAWDWIDFGSASDYSDRFWTLDPIDGTKGFLRGEQYAIALALIVEGRVEVAALACPNLPSVADKPEADGGAVFVAVRGSGAELLSIDGRPMSPIRVSMVNDPAQSRLCESVESAHSKHDVAAAVANRLGIALSPRRSRDVSTATDFRRVSRENLGPRGRRPGHHGSGRQGHRCHRPAAGVHPRPRAFKQSRHRRHQWPVARSRARRARGIGDWMTLNYPHG